MHHRHRLTAVLILIGLAGVGGCALGPGPESTNTPLPGAATQGHATVASDTQAGGTPIPDANDKTPPVEWQDIVIPTAGPVANLWVRIRRGFRLPDGNEARVRQQLHWYANHPGYMRRTAERAQPYLYYVVRQLTLRGMPTDLALLPIVESAYDPFAYSYGQASGLWQFISSTGRHYGLKQNWWYDGRRDIGASTNAALDYLSSLHQHFGSWLLALAAYNSGSATVQNAIRYNRRHGLPTNFWSLRLPLQPRDYVPRLLAIRDIIKNPRRYGIQLPFIPNTPYLAKVRLKGQIDLAVAANMLGISLKQIYLLNPGYNRWATPPDTTSTLYIPLAKKTEFLTKLSRMKQQLRVRWIAYRIRPGNNLRDLAHRFHTTTAELQARNNLRGTTIYAGQTLMVPSPSARYTRYVLSQNMRLAKVQSRPHGPRKIHIRVRPGDTWWALARRYHVSVRVLARWNGMAPGNLLHPGRHLVAWVRGRAPRSANRYPVSAIQKISYVVRNGDSLSAISNRFNVSLRKLAGWNSLSLSSILHPGEHLTLFVDVRNQS